MSSNDDEKAVWSRRRWLRWVGQMTVGARLGSTAAAGGLFFAGCARNTTAPRHRWSLREEKRLAGDPTAALPIVQWNPKAPDPHSILRRRAMAAHPLPGRPKTLLDGRMRTTLKHAGGVGLAAPQVAFSRRLVLVQLQRFRLQKNQKPGQKTVLTCLDPEILWASKETVDGYEACLSVRGYGGKVRRAKDIKVAYHDLSGRRHTHLARDWEARIFQHEIDHLNGTLYLDRLVGPLLSIDEMRRRRQKEKGETKKHTSEKHPTRTKSSPNMVLEKRMSPSLAHISWHEEEPWLL
jgi:peptide deformylase